MKFASEKLNYVSFFAFAEFCLQGKNTKKEFRARKLAETRAKFFFCGGGMKRNDDSNKHKTSIKLWEEEYKIER